MTTAVSYETVSNWFAKAANNAANQGKSESATLWRDGHEHLENFRNQRNEALEALRLAYDFMRGENMTKKELQAALKKAQKVLRDNA